MTTVYIVGAGLAGLACAVDLAAQGRRVVVYERAGHAGGRCRSYVDPVLGRSVDNGNHLLLSGNRSAMAYVARIGARATFFEAPEAVFPFVDLATGGRWSLRPNRGRLPWWLMCTGRRAPGTKAADYLTGLRLARAGAADTVADCLKSSQNALARFWEPLTVAVLNTAIDEGAAKLLWPVLMETFGRGGAACRPLIARDGLSASLVDPALAFLATRGIRPAFGQGLKRLEIGDGRVVGLLFGDRKVDVAPDDRVVLAVPPKALSELCPQIPVPQGSRPIVGAHFRLDEPADPHTPVFFMGLIGGLAHWLFVRGDVASVTISAAGALVDAPADDIARRIWTDAAQALGRDPARMPAWRVIKERRATFAQVPAALSRRPGPQSPLANMFLAGDWTATGLPATIESAVRSGQRAARLVLAL